MRSRHAVLLLALVCSGCMLGTGAGNFRPANGPAGITVAFDLVQGAPLTGELLEVRDTALLVLAGSKVWLVRFTATKSASFRQRGELDFSRGFPPTPRQLIAMRRVARFPTGLTPELRQKLLQVYGQTAESLP